MSSLISSKGGGGGGGRGIAAGNTSGGNRHGASDDWDAPPTIKALFAFQVIWAILTAILFLFTVFKLTRVRSKITHRGPYLLLAVVFILFSISFTLSAAPIRVTFHPDVYLRIVFSSVMIGDFSRTFSSAAILWLVHIRGAALPSPQSDMSSPAVIRPWKRYVDCALVLGIFILELAIHGYTLDRNLAYLRTISAIGRYEEFVKVATRLRHVISTVVVLLAINVIASLAAIKVAHRRTKFTDPVINRLLVVAGPFVFVGAFIWMFADIWNTEHPTYDPGRTLAFSIIGDLSQVVVVAAVLSTIGLHRDSYPVESSSHLNRSSSGPPKAGY
ncbi:hypothetical protein FRC20_010214 [Serendipita sp. 405]|nr:hypothetical protein FRC20_010214 [Serendipita sp. 405]